MTMVNGKPIDACIFIYNRLSTKYVTQIDCHGNGLAARCYFLPTCPSGREHVFVLREAGESHEVHRNLSTSS